MIFFLSYEVSEIYFELDWVVMEESNVPYKYFFFPILMREQKLS